MYNHVLRRDAPPSSESRYSQVMESVKEGVEEEDVNDKDDRPKENWEQQKVTEYFDRQEEGQDHELDNTEQMVLIGRPRRSPTTQSIKEKQTEYRATTHGTGVRDNIIGRGFVKK